MHAKILEFWFSNEDKWFHGGEAFDREIREKFLDLYYDAVDGKLDDWSYDPKKCLALIILVDQFPRNMFRNTGEAFAYDFKGLYLTKSGLKKDYLATYTNDEKRFFIMPLMHSESLPDQRLCVSLFEKLAKENDTFDINLEFAHKHLDIIKKFGRFPHRNDRLGRESTPEEKEFMKHNEGF